MPVMRSLWPGINSNAVASPTMISNMRKIAVQASRFMLQMIQAPLLVKETTSAEDNKDENPGVETDPSLDFESGEEGLAVRIAVEVFYFHIIISILRFSGSDYWLYFFVIILQLESFMRLFTMLGFGSVLARTKIPDSINIPFSKKKGDPPYNIRNINALTELLFLYSQLFLL